MGNGKRCVFDTLICMISFLLDIVNEFGILMTPMDSEVCFIIDHLCHGIFKNIFQLSCLVYIYIYIVFFSIFFHHIITKGLTMC